MYHWCPSHLSLVMAKKGNEACLDSIEAHCVNLKESSHKTVEELQEINAKIMKAREESSAMFQ